ncbi:uncharacterized protein BX663DRAFT_520722 [Cokeromyces recurvatus]|uniref:uncharacterized protein n=1 Tax=Cokeromyces recurvatus TaxID=90255 RepID=UPI002220F672|nr:uncharacterized protein BX663DRAFT_520722 [Cokeromyces recurvatus]KAI7899616.1 hypothetical protein BX663DRAFT_520722 [Cokeromyces recurvatus]
MENPFYAANIKTLKEIFPSIDVTVINDILWSVKGDVNRAFESLLAINSSGNVNRIESNSQSSSPQLPPRTSRLSGNNTKLTTTEINRTNSLNTNSRTSLTFREELAQWRRDLQEESNRRKAARNASVSSRLSRPYIREQNSTYSNNSRILHNHEAANNVQQ